MIQQHRYGRTLRRGWLIQETPRAVLAHHKLHEQTQTRDTAAAPFATCTDDPCPVPYLQRLVKPAVAAVGERPTSMQDLRSLTARVPANRVKG